MIKDRILKISDYSGLTKELFFSKIGMTTANFRGKAKETPINSTAIENILSVFPEINPEWLITGKGPMLKNTSDPSIDSNISVKEPNTHSNTKVDYKEKYYELLEENRELRLKMERIEDKYNIELEKLKETHQKQVKEIENCKKELEKFRKSKNNTTMLPV